jgi:hypothetical protein
MRPVTPEQIEIARIHDAYEIDLKHNHPDHYFDMRRISSCPACSKILNDEYARIIDKIRGSERITCTCHPSERVGFSLDCPVHGTDRNQSDWTE